MESGSFFVGSTNGDGQARGCDTNPALEVSVADRVGTDLVLCPPPFWLTISCSPLDNPRLEIGSSGINVKLLGGYPTFTKKRIKVSYDEPKAIGVPSCCEGSISVIV